MKKLIFTFIWIHLIVFSAIPDEWDGKINDSIAQANILKLREQYSIHKEMPSDLEKEILISLSHYPELKNVRIKFCYSPIFTSMKAVPSMVFLFQKREKRTYRIVMNSKKCMDKNLMQRISSEAVTGVLGHELGHITEYSQLSNFGLLKLLIGYISKKGRIATELRVDNIAVEHGLGKELLEFTEIIFRDECMNPKYIRYKKKYYHSPASLGNLVENHHNAPTF